MEIAGAAAQTDVWAVQALASNIGRVFIRDLVERLLIALAVAGTATLATQRGSLVCSRQRACMAAGTRRTCARAACPLQGEQSPLPQGLG
jgi:hypothetical protein